MKTYKYIDLNTEERIACIILAINTLFISANEKVEAKSITDEIDVICKVYKREDLIKKANQILIRYREKIKA